MDHQDGHLGVPADMLGDAAEERLSQLAMSVTAHHQKIGSAGLCALQQDLTDVTLAGIDGLFEQERPCRARYSST